MLGRDLTKTPDDWPGRALMQYDKNLAYLRGDDVVILQPEHPATGFVYDPVAEKLRPSPQSDEMKKTALGWALWAVWLTRKDFIATRSSSFIQW